METSYDVVSSSNREENNRGLSECSLGTGRFRDKRLGASLMELVWGARRLALQPEQ